MRIIAIVLFAAFALIFSASSSAAVIISEVMYNPAGNDNNREFIEIMGADNLSGLVLGDNRSNDTLVLLKFVPGNISLVVESGFDHSKLNCSTYSAGDTIGNNLNNRADKAFLYLSGSLADWMHYNNSLANNNNRSLELVNGSWQESCSRGGSPCSANCILEEEIISDNETMNDSAMIEEDSSIIIGDIATPSGRLYYGDYLEADIDIYRGNTLKSVVTASLKDENNRKISDELKFKLTKKYTELSTIARFHIKELCAEDKTYTLIVEGLGVSDEKDVRVWQDERLCDNKQSSSASTNAAKSAASTTPAIKNDCQIISFYTRTKNYKENITLYANTDCREGELVLSGMMNNKRIAINSSGTLSFEAGAEPGNNTYTLKLLSSSGRITDSKELLVSLEGRAAKAEDENKKGVSDSGTMIFEAGKNKDEKTGLTGGNSITGGVVYESSNVKLTKIAPILVVIVALLTIGGFRLLRKKGESKDDNPPLPPGHR